MTSPSVNVTKQEEEAETLSTVSMPSVPPDPVDPADPAHGEPFTAEILREAVDEKLTATVREILAAIKRTVAEYEEEISALRQELCRQKRHLELLLQPQVALCRIDGDGSPSTDVSGHAEDPVKSAGPDQDQRDRVHHIQHASGPSEVKDKRRPLDLRVCLLEDTDTLKQNVFKLPIQNLTCPRGLQEPDFLDLLRSTFPQLTEPFEVFTADETRKLTPLRLQTLTPEEIRKSTIRSTLYIRAKTAEKLPTSTEQQRNNEDGNRRRASSDSNKDDHLSSNLTWQQPIETDEEEYETSEYADDDWKPDEAASESEAERDPSKTKRQPSSLKAATRDCARLSCKVWHTCICHVCGKSSLSAIGHTGNGPYTCDVCQNAQKHAEDQLHKCDFCDQSFSFEQQLWAHIRIHTGDKPHRCVVCAITFGDLGSLSQHMLQHVGEKPYGCSVCGKRFLTKRNLRVHAVIHTDRDRTILCDICCKSFRDLANLRSHLRTHREDKFPCRVCGKRLSSEGVLRRHMRIHTGEKPHRCVVCSKTVRDLGSLSQHMLQHVGEKPYGCPICRKRFLTLGTMREHEGIHTNRDRMFHCDICRKKYLTQAHLKTHLRTHSGVKFPCRLCGKRLSTEGALRRHMKIHTGEKPYECSECGQRYRSMANLQSHQRTHGIGPFPCDVCRKKYLTQGQLNAHMKTHTKDKFPCRECGKELSSKVSLRRHMVIHTRPRRMYRCKDCGQSFNRQWSFRTHRKTHTELRPFVCSVCGVRYTHKDYLSAHMRVHYTDTHEDSIKTED